jgi:hypothetical protein
MRDDRRQRLDLGCPKFIFKDQSIPLVLWWIDEHSNILSVAVNILLSLFFSCRVLNALTQCISLGMTL